MRKQLLLIPIGLSALGAWVGPGLDSTALTLRASTDSIASPTGPGAAEPFLATGANGKVYLSWLEPAGTAHSLRFAVLEKGQWSAPRTIVTRSDFFVNWADFPSIKILSGNRLAAHWLQRSGKGTYAYGVRIALSGNGGQSWGEPIMPHRDSSQTEHGFVTLWDDGGALGAAWLDGRNTGPAAHDGGHGGGGPMMLMSTTISPAGRLSAETQLDARTCDCCQNSAAVTSNGPIVAYRDRTTDEIRDIYVTRRVGGKWIAGEPVYRDNWKIAACPVNGPAIAASGNQVAVAWFAAPNDSARVQVAFSSNGGAKFDAPVRVDGGKPAGRVDVALLADGGALVTWVERIGGDTAAVRARRVSRTGVVGVVSTISASSAARASGFPRAVISGTDVVFAWTNPGRPSSIRVARMPLSAFR